MKLVKKFWELFVFLFKIKKLIIIFIHPKVLNKSNLSLSLCTFNFKSIFFFNLFNKYKKF